MTDRIGGVPNQPKPGRRNRVFRETDELWDKAVEKAKAEGLTMTAVLHRALVKYVEEPEAGDRPD